MTDKLVSPETYATMLDYGWDGPRPDAQDIMDVFPFLDSWNILDTIRIQGGERGFKVYRYYYNKTTGIQTRFAVERGFSLAEALAALWLAARKDLHPAKK